MKIKKRAFNKRQARPAPQVNNHFDIRNYYTDDQIKDMDIKPLTFNQVRALVLSTSPFNLWEGAIRSGKTFVSLMWLTYQIYHKPHGEGMILGQTPETIERNFLNTYMEILGEGNYHYKSGRYLDVYYWRKDKEGIERRERRRMYIVGAKDKSAIRRVRGSTLMIGYVDEGTLIPEQVFEEFQGRLSYDESTCLVTTNPDSPNHWLLRNYVEDKEASVDWRRFKFLLEDNLSLGKAYIDRIKRQYRGIPARYNRMIRGNWVLAEGVIYSRFDMNKHVVKPNEVPAQRALRYFVGVDYGDQNPTVFLLIGEYLINGRKVYYILKEFYYSGRERMYSKAVDEFAEDFAKFVRGYKVMEVCVDPSAKALIRALEKTNIRIQAGSMFDVIAADNEVSDGINAVANLIAYDCLYVVDTCLATIGEFGLYSWDEKQQERGVDAPIKDNDHCMDALRYAIYTLVGDEAAITTASGW